MGYYKIKNITDLLPKRHAKANSVQTIQISDSFYNTQSFELKPSSEFLLESNFLPINMHKLRTEGVISVTEIDKNTYYSIQNEQNNNNLDVQVVENKEIVETIEEKAKKTLIKSNKKI